MTTNTIYDYQQALEAILGEEDIGALVSDLPEDPVERAKFERLLTDHVSRALTDASIDLFESAGAKVQEGMAADFQKVMSFSERLEKIRQMRRLAMNAGAQALANGLPPEKAREAVKKGVAAAKAALGKEKAQAEQEKLLAAFRAEVENHPAIKYGYPNRIQVLHEIRMKYRRLGLRE